MQKVAAIFKKTFDGSEPTKSFLAPARGGRLFLFPVLRGSCVRSRRVSPSTLSSFPWSTAYKRLSNPVHILSVALPSGFSIRRDIVNKRTAPGRLPGNGPRIAFKAIQLGRQLDNFNAIFFL